MVFSKIKKFFYNLKDRFFKHKEIVNEVNAEAFGANALTVVDTSNLISLGNLVLSSNDNKMVIDNDFKSDF